MIFNLNNPISRAAIKLACKLPPEFVLIYTQSGDRVGLKAGEDFIYIVGTFTLAIAIGVILAY